MIEKKDEDILDGVPELAECLNKKYKNKKVQEPHGEDQKEGLYSNSRLYDLVRENKIPFDKDENGIHFDPSSFDMMDHNINLRGNHDIAKHLMISDRTFRRRKQDPRFALDYLYPGGTPFCCTNSADAFKEIIAKEIKETKLKNLEGNKITCEADGSCIIDINGVIGIQLDDGKKDG